MSDLQLTEKRSAEGAVIRDCWTTNDGYTVALCRLPQERWTVTRPGGKAPFVYTGDEQDIFRQIVADRAASGVPV